MILGAMTPKTNSIIMLNGAGARHPDRSKGRGWLEYVVLLVGLLSFFYFPLIGICWKIRWCYYLGTNNIIG
jgi:hypothetical protein